MTLLFGVMRSKRVLFSSLFEAFCMGFNRLLYGILRMDTMIRQKVGFSLALTAQQCYIVYEGSLPDNK